jgi:hypothetical protein
MEQARREAGRRAAIDDSRWNAPPGTLIAMHSSGRCIYWQSAKSYPNVSSNAHRNPDTAQDIVRHRSLPAVAMLMFNVGVEAGQLIFAAFALGLKILLMHLPLR